MTTGARILLPLVPLMSAALPGNATLACGAYQQEESRLPPSPDAGRRPARRALLVGISDYLRKEIPDLPGARSDVETMRTLLETRFGFPAAGIRTLLDGEATRAAILAALATLVAEAGPDDVVYVHYSGHGSRAPDKNKDEDDGKDETLVPHDGRTGKVPDILDEELGGILARLKTRNALVVLDCCHSGTGTRNPMIVARGIPDDDRSELYGTGAESRDAVDALGQEYVLLTAAAPQQPALDVPVAPNRSQGLFTYALSRSLASCSPDARAADVFEKTRTELVSLKEQFGLYFLPEPQLEAPRERWDAPLPLAVQDRTNAARRLWALTLPAGPDRVLLSRGADLEARPGSLWAVYPAGETRFLPGDAIGCAIVRETKGQDALAELVERGGPPVPKDSRAILLAPAPPAAGLLIGFLGAGGAMTREAILNALRRHIGGDVRVAGPSESPRYWIEQSESGIRLLGADGKEQIESFPADLEREGGVFSGRLAEVLGRSLVAVELGNLENPASQLSAELRVVGREPVAPVPLGARGFRSRADTATPVFRIQKEGELRTPQNSLQLEVRASADCYITIVDVDSQGGLNVLFPFPDQAPGFVPEGRVRAGEWVRVPDSLAKENRAGFYMDCQPPAGTDTIQVFACKELQTARLFRRELGAQGEAESAAAGRPGKDVKKTLDRTMGKIQKLRSLLLEFGIRGFASRTGRHPPLPAKAEGSPATGPVGDWTAARLTVMTKE